MSRSETIQRSADGLRVVILVSRYHEEVTTALEEGDLTDALTGAVELQTLSDDWNEVLDDPAQHVVGEGDLGVGANHGVHEGTNQRHEREIFHCLPLW